MAPKRKASATAPKTGPKKASKQNKTTQRGLAQFGVTVNQPKEATPLVPVESVPENKGEVAAISKKYDTNEKNKVVKKIKYKLDKFEAAVQKHYLEEEKTNVPDDILALFKTVNKKKKYADRAQALAFRELMRRFPNEFGAAKLDLHVGYLFSEDEPTRLPHLHEEILKNKKAPIHITSPTSTTATKVDHSQKLVTGDEEFLQYNLKPAVAGVPLQLCMIVKMMPVAILMNLLHHYGSLGGYTKAFEMEARTINITKKDELMTAAYDLEFGTIGAGGADPALWALIVDSSNQTEKRLGERGVYQGCAEAENKLSAEELAAVKALANAAKAKKRGEEATLSLKSCSLKWAALRRKPKKGGKKLKPSMSAMRWRGWIRCGCTNLELAT
jgi:hypothetical protein